jgi:hypothetical protein
MMNAHRITRTLGTAFGGLLAVGLGIGAALAATPGVASADSSTDWLSSIDQLLGGFSVPAADPAQALDMQISIGGLDLFPTADNTATATAGGDNIAIAIGNGATATISSGNASDLAFADGANSVASVVNTGDVGPLSFSNMFDIAYVLGTGSTATISGDGGGLIPDASSFDVAAVFGDMLNASITNASNMVDIVP